MIQKTPQPSQKALQKLDRSILLREIGAPDLIRWTLICCSCIVVFFSIWASLIRVDEVSKAKGQLLPSLPVHPIQHFYGGTVAQMHVKDGDIVKVGDLLISFDKAELNSQSEEAQIQLTILMGRKKRLESYLHGITASDNTEKQKSQDVLKGGLEPSPSAVTKIVQDPLYQQQELMLKQIIETVQTQRKVSYQQIQQLYADMESSRISAKSLLQQLELLKIDSTEHEQKSPESVQLLEQEKNALKEEMDIRENLVDQGLNSNIKFLALQREFFQIQKDIMEKKMSNSEKGSLLKRQLQQLQFQFDSIPQDLQRREARIEEIKQTQLLLESKTREQLLTELDQILEEENAIREKSARLKERINTSTVRASIDGIVQRSKQVGAGSVITPGELILNLVPQNAELIAEIHISDKDVGHIHIGQNVRIKLTSFDFSRYGSLPGMITMVDATNTLAPNGSPYFLAKIKILSTSPGGHRSDLFMKSGMSLDADVITGHKTIMEYLLKPIYASTREALHER